MLDHEKADWLAGLLEEASLAASEAPCLIVEVDGSPHQWVQILPQMGEDASLSGYLINLPYRTNHQNPLTHFRKLGIPFPEDARVFEFEAGAFATVWIAPDHSYLEVAHLAGTALENAVEAASNPELSVRLEFGY